MRRYHSLIKAFFIGMTLTIYAAPAAALSVSNTESSAQLFDYHHQLGWRFEAGDSQSPINIDTHKTLPMLDAGQISWQYSPMVIDEVDNGHSIQIDDSGFAVINGRHFELMQFHFHAPSEHKLDGRGFPLEVHFVHQAQDGRLAVIAVFFEKGPVNTGFETILNHIQKGKKTVVSEKINIESLLPKNKTYYHYLGSLTTPPLTENVEWYVMAMPVGASAEQIQRFEAYYKGNNRQLQPVNERTVLVHQE